MDSFIVSGGDFRREDGCLSFVDLDEATGQFMLRDEIWITHPRPKLAVQGKGITGMCLDGEFAWVCFANLIARVRVPDGAVMDLIEDEAFNDLHQLTRVEGGLLLANTGNESVDFISLPDKTIERMDLLGDALRSRRPIRAQHEDTKPHLHHAASACQNKAGDLIVGLGRQARILNVSRWDWASPHLKAGLHDVQCAPDGALWCTTVGGEVHRIDTDGTLRTWKLASYCEQVGWTRGLAVTVKGLMIGLTAIRQSNRDYYQALVQAKVGSAEARLLWISLQGDQMWSLTLPEAKTRKVFSICHLSPSSTTSGVPFLGGVAE